MATASFEVPKLEVETFDTRLQNRHITAGRMTTKDIEKRLKELPDDADNSEMITVYLGEEPPAEVEKDPSAETEIDDA
jgi:hypothetical protein